MSSEREHGARIESIWKFINLLRVEPVLFIIAFQMGLKSTPDSQMIQDKICMHWYNTSSVDNYCQDLPSTLEEDKNPGHYKSRILADATEFGTYNTYMSTPICIIWALFMGAWVDRYVKARKLILLGFCVGGVIENIIHIQLAINWDTSVYYNLAPFLPTLILVGGTAGPTIAGMHYITTTTPPKLIAIRFMILHTCATFGAPIGHSLGGFLLVQDPKLFATGEIRNYTMCYIIALVFEVLAFLWIVFMINERVARKQEMQIEMKIKGQNEEEGTDIKLNTDMSEEDKKIHPVKLLFDVENIKSMFRTIIKNRPNKVRKQIILLSISLAIVQGQTTGLDNIMAQFSQKVYLWTPDWTSYMKSINMSVTGLCTMLFIPICVKIFNVADADQALLGFVLIFIQNLLKGFWLSENAYYLAIAVSAFDGTAKICSKSHISKIVNRGEMGKVMSFLSSLETLAPLLFTTTFAYIFNYTIDSFTGTVFLVMAALLLVPIFVLTWIKFCTERPQIETDKNKHGTTENYGPIALVIDKRDITHLKFEKPSGHHNDQDVVLKNFNFNIVSNQHDKLSNNSDLIVVKL